MQSRSPQRRTQVRQVKPKAPAAPATATPEQQKRQRERYVASGGLLQGYAPELVVRLGYISAAAAIACVLIMALIIALLPYHLPVRIVAALAWVLPIALLASFVLPGYRLARKDLKQDARVLQGTLLGASNVSTSMRLGMLMMKTRAQDEQFLVDPGKLAKVPGNQVQVIVTHTPNLRHVRTVAVMGQRMMPRPDPPEPEVLKRLRLLPLATPAALAGGVILGDDAVSFLPIPNDIIHVVLAIVIGAGLGFGVYFASTLFQRRLMADVQSMVPGGIG